ncbi:MAG: enoyl-CoA hydratase/isomerase family protein [Dehalococcoidia bacterium]|nr:enoyl-CoA hydratase/isomerase family protein [Dehalococcoidia bacterium]
MPAEPVLYEVNNQVAHITLNRPDVMNAQNTAMRTQLQQAFQRMDADPAVRCAIVTGAGARAFSAGVDLKERATGDAAGEQRFIPSAAPPALIEKPVIAAINGYCLAAGLELALRCDIRIATPKSEFGLPEPRWSQLALYGLHNLNRMVPLGTALYMQLTGNRITAQRAYEVGLIEMIVPEERLMEQAGQIAASIVLCAPLAVRAIKRIVMEGRNLPIADAYALGAPFHRDIAMTGDYVEGPRAFAEKRTPQWKGR